jgi:hypothetical protein
VGAGAAAAAAAAAAAVAAAAAAAPGLAWRSRGARARVPWRHRCSSSSALPPGRPLAAGPAAQRLEVATGRCCCYGHDPATDACACPPPPPPPPSLPPHTLLLRRCTTSGTCCSTATPTCLASWRSRRWSLCRRGCP